MSEIKKTYIAIDLKSFYASVECIERGLDPMDANLVVADKSRTEKTICLAVSPSLKSYGISGRARLFEVVQRVKEVNFERRRLCGEFAEESILKSELDRNSKLKVGYEVAKPRMAHYINYSRKVYSIYLRYVSPEDIHVYSIDEVFIDATGYLEMYKMTGRELAVKIIDEVFKTTGITATAGIGTNMYLCKIAMDIVAKHVEPNENGVRIAELDEMSYRRKLWNHRPITDFWRVGKGYAAKLEKNNIYTMGDVARCSLDNEELLYELFGINAELLIDHAWGWEPVTIDEIKKYRPENNSFSSGQVLQKPYSFEEAAVVAREMADSVALDLVDKKMVTNQMTLTVGYDIESLKRPEIRKSYKGEITTDAYGRKIPKHAHGTFNLTGYTSSSKEITDAVLKLYDKLVNPKLLIRRITITTNHVILEKDTPRVEQEEQLDFFTDYKKRESERKEKEECLLQEKSLQEAMLSIKKKYGKNAVLKGTNLKEGATGRERNAQIGGHKA